MASSIDSITKRILGRTYSDPNQLAREVADGLSSLARQPSFTRGLSGGVIADVQGGTTLGVGDPSAARISDVLVQNPQPGIPRNIGLGLRTRRQARVETLVRQLPAIVTENASAGDSVVQVKVVGTGVTKSTDAVTGIQIVGDTLGLLASSGMSHEDVVGEEFEASVSGDQFVTPGNTGLQPPVAGQTIFVTLSEQWEVSTVWTTRFRKNKPTVVRVLKNRTVTVTNGLENIS